MNKKIFIFLLFFLTNNAYATFIDQTFVDGCELDNFITNNDIANLLPVYEPTVYTCSSGQFLPANTLGCRSCPTGYNCPGGQFKFNETQSQGLEAKPITASTQYTCSKNFLNANDNNVANLIPVFDPNTININWYSVGDTVYETNQCTYDQPITLPATNPTRTGYIFSGWRLRTTPAQ